MTGKVTTLAILMLFFSAWLPVAPAEAQINFADTNLETAVREAIDKPDGEILVGDVEGLEELDASNRSITVLSGLEYCSNLIKLNLDLNQITDLNALGSLTKLQDLTLRENQITDVAALSSLTQLENLGLWSNQISDLTPLSDLAQLKELHLHGNQISDLVPLSNMTQLVVLNLGANSINDVSALSNLSLLEWLELSSNQLTDVSALSGLTHLTWLGLRGNQLTDVSALSGLTQLTVLLLGYNQLTDLSPLSGLSQLRNLMLSDNQVSDLSPLANLTMIGVSADENPWWIQDNVHLNLSNNRIKNIQALLNNVGIGEGDGIDLQGNLLNVEAYSTHIPELESRGVTVLVDNSPIVFVDENLETVVRETINKPDGDILLSDLEGLEELDASNQFITVLTGIEYCYNLKNLNLNYNQISDLTALAGLHQLEVLNLDSNQIMDLNPLAGLVQLVDLDIGGNQQIEDVSPLANMDQLIWLKAQYNQISDVSDLSHLDNLVYLQIEYNRLSDLSSLRDFTQLQTLLVKGNGITDVSALSGLVDLQWLFLGDNEISDINPLTSLNQLTQLSLMNNQIEDITPLADLVELQWLRLDGNRIEDISPLVGLIKIGAIEESYRDFWLYSDGIFLGLENNRIRDIQPLLSNPGIGEGDGISLDRNPLNIEAYSTHIPELESRGVTVLIDNSPIVFADENLETAVREAINKPNGDIFVRDVNELTQLQIFDKGITDVSALSDFYQLETLELDQNQISDVSAFSNLTQLKKLSLSENQISDVNPLSNLAQLTDLNLAVNQVTDVSALSGLTQLTQLNLGHMHIGNVSALSNLTQLKWLDLRGCRLNDVNELSNLTQLEWLDLRDNQLKDVSVLSDLAQLTWLRLENNQLNDISPLSELTRIGEIEEEDLFIWIFQDGIHLNLSNNQINDIKPLVDNPGIDEGDVVDLKGNPLNAEAYSTHIPALQARGVEVLYDELAPRIKNVRVDFIHSGGSQEDSYSVSAWIEVEDPQGLDTITDVELKTPDGSLYAALKDDGEHCDSDSNDGRYGLCSGEANPTPLDIGDYSFAVRDTDGNETTYIRTLAGWLDIPEVTSPSEESIITSPFIDFYWDAVEGASEYSIDIWNMQDDHLWNLNSITENHITYSDTDNGELLVSGQTYRWRITALSGTAVSFWEGKFSYVIPEGPISVDFNLADGDQEQRKAGNASLGLTYQLQLNVLEAPEINGWSANIEYDPLQIRYITGSFQASDFIPGMLALVDEKEGMVSVGGTTLGTAEKNSGDGTLGTLSFEVLEGFSDSTELTITRVTFRRLDDVEDKRTVHSVALITSASMIPGDFDGNNKVDFDDFFLFADAFGGNDPQYDLDSSGSVDFDDFFLFADNFGKEARAKLIALAQEYIGLPVTPGLEPNYPNPFNASTTIRYRVVEPGQVRLDIFDLTGQKVKSFTHDLQDPGFYEIVWDGTDEQEASVSSGLYFARLGVGEFSEVRKMMLMK